ncbi:hypothetical protein [Novosphingobium sp. Fuku2-ISO-50]|uniref:hypothetical protein n=1 Tax=Novosphingobium sp. Fuku2-ISO-50 TaxID=1739114 RepID=UPI00076DD6DE|nr:hypothetical protein [Novosphingobium sp. Fuku2-ISO-50]KUR74157.1 hypothetical protein AQZ50_18420 [Novosphingobium sp. Fuku2-ISO-50]
MTMDFWIAIVAIVAITSFAKVMRSRHIAMARIEAARGDNADHAALAREGAALAREVAALNARVAVLERIITDNRSSLTLAHEIDALRDH